MKKLISIALALAFNLAHAESVYQWGGWDTNQSAVTTPGSAPRLGRLPAAPVSPQAVTSTADFRAPTELLQAAGTRGYAPAFNLDSDLSSLKAGNVTASYSGSSSLGLSVSMSVDFGQSSWTGRWADQESKATAFTANGSIAGSTISGTVSPASGSLYGGGTVNGAFSGGGANTITGTTNLALTAASMHTGTFTVRK